MKILNVQELSEKLNIQPVTRERLRERFFAKYTTEEDMLKNLQTGDIVRLHQFEDETYVYISYGDILKKTYDRILGIKLSADESSENGILVVYAANTFSYFGLSSDYMGNEHIGTVVRMPNLKLPVDTEYFQNPPMDKGVVIYQYKQ